MSGARITALGMAVPDAELTNAELGARLGVDEAWIFERTGIRTRRIAAVDESAAVLGSLAAERALVDARLDALEIDLIICATITGDRRFPATACLIGASLGTQAPAYDLNAGCSGFLFALAQADAAVRSGSVQNVLVIGSDVMSRITDPHDLKTAILFGDGAGAAIIQPASPAALGPFLLASDGSRPDVLTLDERDLTRMEGREVYRMAVAKMASSLSSLLTREGIRSSEIDLVIGHQANQRILTAVAERMALDEATMYSNISRWGNTSAASIPLALYEAQRQGAMQIGDRVALAAFGAGFCWGAGLLEWTPAPLHAELTSSGTRSV